MKQCVYCAEEIQTEATLCRYCKRSVPLGAQAIIHQGTRYGIGRTTRPDQIGIWDLTAGGLPIATYTDDRDGGEHAWLHFDKLEHPTHLGTPRRSPSAWAVIAGGAAVAVAPFLTWVHVVLLGNLRLADLLALDRLSPGLVWVGVALGVTAAVTAANGRGPTVKVAAIVIGVISAWVSIQAYVQLSNAVGQAHGFASLGVGPILAVAGSVAMVIGGVLAPGRS